jgi:hypothetical protein
MQILRLTISPNSIDGRFIPNGKGENDTELSQS